MKERGFSLVSVMIAVGLLGGVALGVMKLFDNINKSQSTAQAYADEIELRTALTQILSDERYCRVSLAGNGPHGSPITPVRFRKSNIDADTEGLDVELFLSNQAGDTRTQKKYSGTDTSFNKVGKLEIKSMKLIMNNPTIPPGNDYSQSTGHSDVGEILVSYGKKVGTAERILEMRFPVTLGMSTSASGQTTILSCSRETAASDTDSFGYPQSCSISISHSDNGGAFRTSTLNMNDGGFAAIRLRGDVNSDDRFRLSGNCGSGDQLSAYFAACQIGFGWSDTTDNGSTSVASPLTQYNSSFNSTITLQTGGDVNEDDSFYYRIRCPNGSNPELNDYVKTKCMICMGHTDRWYSSPEKSSCHRIQNSGSSSWGRIMTSGDVSADDALFIGFFCDAEFAPIIKSWAY